MTVARACRRAAPRRTGGVSLYLLLVLPLMLLAMALALFSATRVETLTTLHASADAAALAAANALADDDLLRGNPGPVRALLEKARFEARRYARLNPSAGRCVILDPNPDNDPCGDVVFGTLETPRSTNLVPADLRDPDNRFLHLVNTVRVRASRTAEPDQDGTIPPCPENGPFAIATATLDRCVVGFRPQENGFVPLMPIALLSDPKGEAQESWEFQVQRRGGQDGWGFDKEQKRCRRAEGGDGLHEMQVFLGGPPKGKGGDKGGKNGATPNACLLLIGAGPEASGEELAVLLQQVSGGVGRAHLRDRGSEFVLGSDNTIIVPGVPSGPGGPSAAFGQLRKALDQVCALGEPRIWPLFNGFDPQTGMPVVTGFVAARIAEVGVPGSGEGIALTLQPCLLAAPAAVTDPDRRVNGRPIHNPYLCKVRLVE